MEDMLRGMNEFQEFSNRIEETYLKFKAMLLAIDALFLPGITKDVISPIDTRLGASGRHPNTPQAGSVAIDGEPAQGFDREAVRRKLLGGE